MADPRRLQDSRDAFIAALYAKRDLNSEDVFPILTNTLGELVIAGNIQVSQSGTASTITNAAGNPVQTALTDTRVTVDNIVRDLAGNLCINMTVGTVSLSSTASTITNAAANPVPVTGNVNVATITIGTVTVSGNVNISSATLGTVTISGTVTPSTTASTITNAVGNPVNVSLTSTVVTVANTAGTVTNSVSTIMLMSKTITGATGSVSATFSTIFTPSTRAKIFALSLTTTSATEVTVLFCNGTFANSKEMWRVTLMAPAGTNSGANLAVAPPGFLFQSRSASSVTISLSTAVLVHYSISLFDEA